MKKLKYKLLKEIKHKEGFEPSGIVVNNKDELLVISDTGEIYINGKYSIIKKDKDYEGITIDENDIVYIVEEGKDKLIQLDNDYKIDKKIKVSRIFNNELVLNKEGNGLEGLTYYKNDLFFICNQSDEFEGDDKSALLLINKKGEILEYHPQEIKDLAGLHFYKDILLVLSDREQSITLMNEKFEILEQFKFDLKNIEGVYFKENKLYLAQDTGKTYILEILSKKFLKYFK